MASIAHYNLLERIGEGGLGEVFRARDTKVGRTVALKVLSPEIAGDPARLKAILEDARAATRVSHPNIATLFDVGEADGQHYLAYEFASGRTIRDELASGALAPRRALDLAVQIADGVADAHGNGVLHGDLRPETIVVTAKGSAKILDFGIAPWTRGGAIRARAAVDPDGLPPEAAAVVAYLSPEQAIGSAVDPRTDVFSLGTLTCEMVTGVNPFAHASVSDTIAAVMQGRFIAPSRANPAVPADLDPVIARALAADLGSRQQSAAALAAELRSVAATLDVRGGEPGTISGVLPIDDGPDRSAARFLTLTLVVLAALAGLGWWLLRAR